ncbi:MAG: enoyl-CoA hydratase/isomerase family protein [Desulfobacterales bacterium]|nr:enoyl-CoA hydratase/isomerase family protein [Desulfobacterales bacterium]
MSYSSILFEIQNHTGIVTLNRPSRMNAVIESMYEELLDVFQRIRKSSIRTLILTGAPYVKNGMVKGAFCAGADLKEHAKGDRTIEEKRAYIELAHRTCLTLRTLSVPVIAAVGGAARGAGAELALNCDFILMAESATLGFPESGLGTMVGGGATRHLERVVGHVRARELLFTGRIINGIQATQMGLALSAHPSEMLMDNVLALADTLAAKAPHSMALLKELMERAPDTSLERVYDKETDAIVSCMSTRDWQEGIDAFKEKRPPRFKGE